MQAIEQQDLVFRQTDRLGSGAPALLEIVDRFFDGFAVEQFLEMLVEQLDVQRFRRFEVTVVDPVGRMLDQGPEIIVEIEHEEPQALFFEPLRQLDRRGGLARRTRSADPEHAQGITGVEPCHDLPRGLVERRFILGQ